MNKTDIPAPIYAAAGAGELAYQKLRQLPELAARTVRTAGQTAEELRRRIAARDSDLTAEWAKVRDSAQRGTAVVVAKAANAQEKAATGYRNLVARGERVVNGRLGVATGHSEPAGIEVEVGPVQAAERPSETESNPSAS
jgi:heparin binding hemagglutinin HbhA